MFAIEDNNMKYLDRITVEVDVTDIPKIYKALNDRHVVIDHFYDY